MYGGVPAAERDIRTHYRTCHLCASSTAPQRIGALRLMSYSLANAVSHSFSHSARFQSLLSLRNFSWLTVFKQAAMQRRKGKAHSTVRAGEESQAERS
jgi:hypothetical protein